MVYSDCKSPKYPKSDIRGWDSIVFRWPLGINSVLVGPEGKGHTAAELELDCSLQLKRLGDVRALCPNLEISGSCTLRP